jgi:ketosteroid isomerase-like protein
MPIGSSVGRAASRLLCGIIHRNKLKWSTDPDATDEIRQLIDRYVTAGAKGDLQGALDTMTDDVVFLPPNDTPKVDKEKLRCWLLPFQEHYTSKDMAQSRELHVAGDIAYEWGLFQERFTPKDPASGSKPISLNGKFLRFYWQQINALYLQNSFSALPRARVMPSLHFRKEGPANP